MTRDEMIISLRRQLSDEQAVGWPDDSELLAHLDHGCDFVSEQLIAHKDPTMKKKIFLNGNGQDLVGFDIDVAGRDLDPLYDGEPFATELPDDFVRFVGNVPVEVVGRIAKSYDKRGMSLDYWAKLAYPSSFMDGSALPYTREQALLILTVGRTLALNRNEFDVSQDMTLVNSLNQAIASTRKGG